jgi:SAM-dependent methyltransferase
MHLEPNPAEFVCAKCRVPVEAAGEHWRCTGCLRLYGKTLTIPVFHPEYTGSPDRLARMMAAGSDASWLELLPLLHPKGSIPQTPDRVQRWADERILRHDRFYRMFQQRSREIWPDAGRRVACEIGCGRGDGLPALARDFDRVIGVDINLPSLVGAAKLVAERGLSNVTLVQASAHELPFPDGSFDYVQAINVIEHVFRPDHFFEEMKRVLAPNGVFCGDSRNRFDLLFPEPHVKLMWVGLLPRRLMSPYVRLRSGHGYTGVNLLSYFELERALKRNFGRDYRIVVPDLRVYSPKLPASIPKLFEGVHRSRVVERAVLPLFPTHIALARRYCPEGTGSRETEEPADIARFDRG